MSKILSKKEYIEKYISIDDNVKSDMLRLHNVDSETVDQFIEDMMDFDYRRYLKSNGVDSDV